MYKWYPKQRLPTSEELVKIHELLDLGVSNRNIKDYVGNEMSGKCINSQDIRNIRFTLKAERNAGRSNENVLIDTLKHLNTNDEQSKVFTLTGDEENILTAVCFQTGIMRERYEKNGDVLLVDTTYKNNIEGYPLLVFLVENRCRSPCIVCFCSK